MTSTYNAEYNFLNKYTKITQFSSEWTRLEYLLQLSLGSTSATIRNIWAIANPHGSLSFEKQCKNQLIVDSWLETSVLDEQNRIERVCQKGFEMPSNGIKFSSGHVKVQEQLHPGKLYQFLFSKIAVGKSYSLPDNTTKDKYKLVQGFDSVYLYNEDEDPMSGVFKHDYVMFDAARVLPCYVVHFEFDQRKEENLNVVFCDICNDNSATIYCKADDMCLCYECDEEHHLKGGKLVSKHIRVPIAEKPKSFGVCSQHPEQKLELYCLTDRQAMCVYCKIAGSHSVGESSQHQLVKISDAYSKALAESKEIDPLIEKRKNSLAELLQQIDMKIKDVNKNASYVEQRIYQILQEALQQLQEETQKKMSYLIGDQLELKRQYDQIQWMESFLKYQQEVLTPADYLIAWSRHIGLRNDTLTLQQLPPLTIVQADIRVEGKLTVISEQINQMQQNTLREEEIDFAESVIGTTRFRSNIFTKHQIAEKKPKSIIQQSPLQTPEIQLFKQQSSKMSHGSPEVMLNKAPSRMTYKNSNVFQKQEIIHESDYQDSQTSFAQQ